MTFLAPWMIALAAGITIPPLVALYFLKLRRQAKTISSTLLWRRAIEDLQVNAPFQRIRNNLLLWLQLLILVLAALALGRPVMQAQQSSEDTVIVLIDQSASMNVEEQPGRTRLDEAKDQARTVIDNMPQGSRAMVIGFADRASIVSSFENDKKLIQQRIDEIEATDSTTTLSEAMTLAEAYMQNLIISQESGPDIEVSSSAGPARAVILTDGNVADAAQLSVRRLPTENIEVVSIGKRTDNVGIMSMDTRRNYERPEMLEAFATVRNFGQSAVKLDAHLFINGEHADVQSMVLQPGRAPATTGDEGNADTNGAGAPPASALTAEGAPPPGSMASVAFDPLAYEGGGVVEVRLSAEDALECDNRAWSIIQPPRSVSVLLVTAGDVLLEDLLAVLPLEYETMSPSRYESASDDELLTAGRSRYDVVIFDGYSTGKLPPGNYMFFGGVPKIDGVEADGYIDDEVIFNWDETHAILRYVAIETVQVYKWLRLKLPPTADIIVEGETSPIMATLSHQGRQFLICAFPLLITDEVTGRPMANTDWWTKAHFPVFMYNCIQQLSGSLSAKGLRNTKPGEPLDFPAPKDTDAVTIVRPDSEHDRVPTGGFTRVNYARTRRVGVYMLEDGTPGEDRAAVNLFDAVESNIAPEQSLTLAGQKLEAEEGVKRVNKPLWPWLLIGIVVVLITEWAVYSKRVYV